MNSPSCKMTGRPTVKRYVSKWYGYREGPTFKTQVPVHCVKNEDGEGRDHARIRSGEDQLCVEFRVKKHRWGKSRFRVAPMENLN